MRLSYRRAPQLRAIALIDAWQGAQPDGANANKYFAARAGVPLGDARLPRCVRCAPPPTAARAISREATWRRVTPARGDDGTGQESWLPSCRKVPHFVVRYREERPARYGKRAVMSPERTERDGRARRLLQRANGRRGAHFFVVSSERRPRVLWVWAAESHHHHYPTRVWDPEPPDRRGGRRGARRVVRRVLRRRRQRRAGHVHVGGAAARRRARAGARQVVRPGQLNSSSSTTRVVRPRGTAVAAAEHPRGGVAHAGRAGRRGVDQRVPSATRYDSDDARAPDRRPRRTVPACATPSDARCERRGEIRQSSFSPIVATTRRRPRTGSDEGAK